MPFDVLNPWMLLGLAGLAIPIIIHLLNRRRYDVVDWGAMQFLKISEVTRRRLMLEELLLMLLRMALIALLVFGLAGPFLENSALARLGPRVNREVVLVLDGSYSMGYQRGDKSLHDAAKEWATKFTERLSAGDHVAVLQAKQQVVPVVGELSTDLERSRQRINSLPAPAGSADWPRAVQAAHTICARGQLAEQDIVLIGDAQRFGWADDDSLVRWELLAHELGMKRIEETGGRRPRVWVVNVAPERPEDPPNWALTPLRSNRPVVPVEREITFRTDIVLRGQAEYMPPHKIRLEIDGKWVRDLDPPRGAKIDKGKVPFSFTHKFGQAGSHLVTLQLEPDPPLAERPAGYQLKDTVPGDNRQDYAVDVVHALPVLIVDGEESLSARYRGSDFLRDALAPARDLTPAVQVRVVPIREFDPVLLQGESEGEKAGGAGRPRVLILANVAKLSPPQSEAIGRFLDEGGGVLVTLGDRVEREYYNDHLYRGGQGWLPARLDGIEGEASDLRNAVRPAPEATTHPALDLFRDMPAGGGLTAARFPRWWKLTTPGQNAPGVSVAALRSATAEFPFLVERAFRNGRVLIASTPLDNSWGANVTSLPAFVPLAHELVYYLAGARSAEFNLPAGQPVRFRLDSEGTLTGFRLQPPSGDAKPLTADATDKTGFPVQLARSGRSSIIVYEGARETGVYRLLTPDEKTVYYVVPPDGRESELTVTTDDERAKVAKLLPTLKYETDPEVLIEAPKSVNVRQQIWWWFLLGLIALLCSEVWMTRRMVKSR